MATFASGLAMGCSRPGVPVLHPVNTGALAPTKASGLTTNEENMVRPIKERGVVKAFFPERMELEDSYENALTDTATLVRLDGVEACFDVTLGTPASMEQPFQADRFKLIYDDGETVGIIRKARPRVAKTIQRVGEFWDDRGSKYEVVDEAVVSLGGIVCFEHGGELAANTSRLRLYVTSPLDHLNHESFRFQLTANPEVDRWPTGDDGKPKPFVAPGYEDIVQVAPGSAPHRAAAKR